MLLITARIGKSIRIGEMDLQLLQVRGASAKLAVIGATSSSPRVLRKDGASAPFAGSVMAGEGDVLEVGEIRIRVAQMRGPQVRLGIDAPRDVRISTATLDAARKAKETSPCAASAS